MVLLEGQVVRLLHSSLHLLKLLSLFRLRLQMKMVVLQIRVGRAWGEDLGIP
jgi:hypothetical protein